MTPSLRARRMWNTYSFAVYTNEYGTCKVVKARFWPWFSNKRFTLFLLRSAAARLLRSNLKRFRGGLVFKIHRLVYHSTLGSRVIQKRRSDLDVFGEGLQDAERVGPERVRVGPNLLLGGPGFVLDLAGIRRN